MVPSGKIIIHTLERQKGREAKQKIKIMSFGTFVAGVMGILSVL